MSNKNDAPIADVLRSHAAAAAAADDARRKKRAAPENAAPVSAAAENTAPLLHDSPSPEFHLAADELNAFAAQRLPFAARVNFLKHLADCDDCRHLLAALAADNISASDDEAAAAARRDGDKEALNFASEFLDPTDANLTDTDGDTDVDDIERAAVVVAAAYRNPVPLAGAPSSLVVASRQLAANSLARRLTYIVPILVLAIAGIGIAVFLFNSSATPTVSQATNGSLANAQATPKLDEQRQTTSTFDNQNLAANTSALNANSIASTATTTDTPPAATAATAIERKSNAASLNLNATATETLPKRESSESEIATTTTAAAANINVLTAAQPNAASSSSAKSLSPLSPAAAASLSLPSTAARALSVDKDDNENVRLQSPPALSTSQAAANNSPSRVTASAESQNGLSEAADSAAGQTQENLPINGRKVTREAQIATAAPQTRKRSENNSLLRPSTVQSDELKRSASAKPETNKVRRIDNFRFRETSDGWIDTAYRTPMRLIDLPRNSEQFRARAADAPALRRIAAELNGAVIVVIGSQAYRVR